MWTPEFEAYVAPARVKPQIWRLVLGTILAAVIWVVITLLVFAGAGILLSLTAGSPVTTSGIEDFLQGRTPVGAIVVLATFGGMLIGALVVARVLHGRGWGSLFGPGVVRGFVPAAAITLGIGGISALWAFSGDLTPVPNVPLSLWLGFLLPALIVLLIQTGAEELLFRGYLQSQLAARFRSPVVWMLLPAALFGALHVDPVSVIQKGQLAENDHLIFLATGLVGLLTADLTRVTGGIGAAWGLHFANNVQALLVVSLPDILSGLSLYHTPFGKEDTEILPMLLAQDMVLLVIIWAVIRLWLARRTQ